ncbi:signal peptidase II [Bacillota bacterium LX-D]|nr:signal peptidase II [Bacillota bacterium LX-D]
MLLFWIAGVILALDQITKYIVIRNMLPGQSIPVFPGIFHLTFVENPGGAFSLFANQTASFVVLGTIITALIIFVYFRLKPEQKLFKAALALEVGGALGNLIDRVRTGYVTDFFDFRIWPVFNIADMAIVLGVIILCWELLRRPEEKDTV